MRSDFSSSRFFCACIAIWLLAGCQPATEPSSGNPAKTKQRYQINEDPSVSANVRILDEVFTFPKDMPRRVWVYLPPGYSNEDSHYPVVYMHDGQNVFSRKTSYAGEWGVDETLDALSDLGESVPIVVAIDHGGEARMQELSPWSHPEFGDAMGDAYLDFVVHEVKPYIDNHYRTLPSANFTAVMGSSMGGLMSHYAIVKYPDVFSRAAVFSPSFWFSQKAFTFTESHPVPDTHKLYFNVGEEEDSKMRDGMSAMVNLHLAQQHPEAGISSKVVGDHNHNEAFWHSEVEPALRWLGLLSKTKKELPGAH